MEPTAITRQPLHRGDPAVEGRYRQVAGRADAALDEHEARPAQPHPAAEPRSGQTQVMAEHVEQRCVRLAGHPALGAVHGQPELGLHQVSTPNKVSRPPPLNQLSHRCGDCIERIIWLIGVANYGKSDSVKGGREIRPREWREIDHVPPMSYGRAWVFKKKYDLGSARCIEIIGDG